MKRKYIAPILLLLLYPVWIFVNNEADKSGNVDSAKWTIVEWRKELHDKFPEIVVKRVEHPDVGSMLEVSGSVRSAAELDEVQNWFRSQFYQDERDFTDLVVPSSARLVEYNIKVLENAAPETRSR